MAACVHHIQSWYAAKPLKLNATKTELIWFDRRSGLDDDKKIKNLNLDPQRSIPPSDVIRDLGVLLDCRLYMTQHVSSIHGQNMFFPPTQNSTSETLS